MQVNILVWVSIDWLFQPSTNCCNLSSLDIINTKIITRKNKWILKQLQGNFILCWIWKPLWTKALWAALARVLTSWSGQHSHLFWKRVKAGVIFLYETQVFGGWGNIKQPQISMLRLCKVKNYNMTTVKQNKLVRLNSSLAFHCLLAVS